VKTDKRILRLERRGRTPAPGHEKQKKKEEKRDEEAAPKKKASGRPKGASFRGAKEPKARSTEVLARALEAAYDT
jgi:hypothetical protein